MVAAEKGGCDEYTTKTQARVRTDYCVGGGGSLHGTMGGVVGRCKDQSHEANEHH